VSTNPIITIDGNFADWVASEQIGHGFRSPTHVPPPLHEQRSAVMKAQSRTAQPKIF
jgi:hypothetical protein